MMTLEDLKKLPDAERKHLYGQFWISVSTAREGSDQRRRALAQLYQLKTIFGLDNVIHRQWVLEFEAHYVAIGELLDVFLAEAAA